ncbi:response regulator [Pelagibius sp. 7325]|uniref:response regulator n=1 Tax=Pelagibius sp. 7325 TaxID=3131994 RepID=UPI0030ED4196
MLAGQVIVLLEDDELIRRATERMLRRFGAEVVIGTSSSEALEAAAARNLTPSCIIADYWLSPQEDGLSAAAAVRAAVRAATAKPLRGLIITGDLSKEVAEDVRRAGFVLLRKPVNVDKFLDALTGPV